MTKRTQDLLDLSPMDTGDPRANAPIRDLVRKLAPAFGKTVSLDVLTLLSDMAGYQITNAATAPGTDIAECRTAVDLADAGVDQVRVVVRGKNSAAGSVTVQVYRVTGATTLASVTVTDGTLATFAGDWTVIIPTGLDEDLGVRVVGDGAFDPTFYRIELQMRTLRVAI